MRIINRLADRFGSVRPLPEGIHHRRGMLQGKVPYRLHLRLRKDGSGLLIVNASTVLDLNPTGAEFAFHFVGGAEPETAARHVAGRYQIGKAAALEEYRDFTGKLEALLSLPDLDPVADLGFERANPRSADLTAPLRLDCALTYRLPRGTRPDRAPVKRVKRELDTDEWKAVLDGAWRVGVPHVTFTGGEPTLRPDLAELVAHAESNGQVCGLLTDGLRFVNRRYFDTLLQAGLDHVLIVLQPTAATAWRAVAAVVKADISATVHLTLRPNRRKAAAEALKKLARAGIRSVSLSASAARLSADLGELRNRASEFGLSLKWDLPVPYSEMNPVATETSGENSRPGAGRAWLYVEPDGDVLPSQGAADRVLGNILQDGWEKIYPPSASSSA